MNFTKFYTRHKGHLWLLLGASHVTSHQISSQHSQSLLKVFTLGLGKSPNTLSPKIELVWTLFAIACKLIVFD